MEFISNTNRTFDATPSYKLINTMGFGTYTLESAIADIIDNSITAQAKNISIKFNWNNDLDKCFVIIQDDGYGMTSSELEAAMVFSGKGMDDERTENDLGKYGLGMKTASFFACKCLTVISKKENSEITAKRLDQQFVSTKQEWIGNDLDGSNELKQINLEHGTIVRWDKLNFVEKSKNSEKFFLERVSKVVEHISEFFHRFIEDYGISITVNGYKVKPWNPTFISNIGTTRIDSTKIQYKGETILINSYLLPSSLKCTEEEIAEMYRGYALKYQGVYVYRNNRLLIGGGWLGIKKLSLHQQYNPVRITVDISSNLDSEFKVDFTKSLLKFPKEVEEKITKIAQIARSKASEAYKNRAIKVRKPGISTNDEVWNIIQNKNGIRFSINVEHPLIKMYTKDMDKKDRTALIKLLSKSIPSTILQDKKPTFTVEEINIMIQRFIVCEINKGKSINEIYNEICYIEPFVDYLELVQAFFEEGGLISENKRS